jgi:hypothetical protein
MPDREWVKTLGDGRKVKFTNPELPKDEAFTKWVGAFSGTTAPQCSQWDYYHKKIRLDSLAAAALDDHDPAGASVSRLDNLAPGPRGAFPCGMG